MSTPKAFILAGGVGTRLGDLTTDRPKALVDVCGKPIMDWILDDLRERGVKQVALLVGHMAEQIEKRYGAGSAYGLEITYLRDEFPGTGQAILNAIRDEPSPVLVMNGDSMLEYDLDAFISFHKSRGGAISLLFARAKGKDRGIVKTGDLGQVDDYIVRGKSNVIAQVNTGVYLIDQNKLTAFDTRQIISWEEDMMPMMVERGKVFAKQYNSQQRKTT